MSFCTAAFVLAAAACSTAARPPPTDRVAAATRAWARAHLDRPLPLAELAAHAGMSTRTFTRHFRAEVGTSPRQWLLHQRTEAARQLLETSDLPVDQVARQVGFGSAASLRQHLQQALGMSPAAYRRTFRARPG